MAGHTILLNLIGGVALLLWGTHMVQAAILQGLRRRDPRRDRPRAAGGTAAGGGDRRRGGDRAAERHRHRGAARRLRRPAA